MSEFLSPLRRKVNKAAKSGAAKISERNKIDAFQSKRRAEGRFLDVPGVKRALVSGYVLRGFFYATVPVFGQHTAISAPMEEVGDFRVLEAGL
jgi:hypothetical protein